MSRDARRSEFYATERLIFAMLDRAGGGAHTVQIAGATLTVPAEARFGALTDVQRYVERVLALGAVRAEFPRAMVPVSVRRRRSGRGGLDGGNGGGLPGAFRRVGGVYERGCRHADEQCCGDLLHDEIPCVLRVIS